MARLVLPSLCLIAALAATCSGVSKSAMPECELELEKAWPVEGPGRFQPSGLVLHEGSLWTVSDKHGAAVFALAPDGQVARATEVLSDEIDPPLDGWFDAEGITIADDGSIYLASEEQIRVYRRKPNDPAWTLASPALGPVGRAVGLFAKHNAALEGIAAVGGDTLVLAAEREPRGLIELTGFDKPSRMLIQKMNTSKYEVPAGRVCDFGDLTVWHRRLFALARNQHLVLELVRDADGKWTEGLAWSYAATENAPEYAYRGHEYGLGEGLAIDDDRIYIVLDSNDDVRANDPSDARPQLFIFKNAIAPAGGSLPIPIRARS